VSGLARSLDTAAALVKLGIAPLRGTLDDADVLGKAACAPNARGRNSNGSRKGRR